ncbi:MAG: hypothetical protein KatS3mg124_2046 [Porticoccaceae bacterium]|nr:MAG: hypothetical protein KatS3mg124_2046 [Porticoccaceae bacterium]
MASRKKVPDFEKRLDELERLVETLESGSLSLEEALRAFERGIAIVRECQRALAEAEQKVVLLTREGEQALTALPAEEGGEER